MKILLCSSYERSIELGGILADPMNHIVLYTLIKPAKPGILTSSLGTTARSQDLCSVSLNSSCPNGTVENSLLLLCQAVPLDCELLKAKDLIIALYV